MRQLQAPKLALAVCGFSALWSLQAHAQDSDTDARLKQMQEQIEALQQQVRDMKAEKKQQQAKSGQDDAPDRQQQARKPASSQPRSEQDQPQQDDTTSTADARPSKDQDKLEEEKLRLSEQNKKGSQEYDLTEQDEDKTADAGPNKSLNIGGSAVVEYQNYSDGVGDQPHSGGDFILDYFSLNALGEYGDLTYAFEGRISSNNIDDTAYLHYGWATYDFTDNHQVKGGYFQVPFGNYPTGYQSFWGSLGYYAGFNDTQAAGIGYKYENGPWRVDLDAFKNDDLGQASLYASTPDDGYDQVNEGNGRLAYTFNHDGDNTLNVSLSARGGQFDVGAGNGRPDRYTGSHNGSHGSHWAVAAAAQADLGLWTLQAQVTNYKYNIPKGRADSDSNVLSDRSVMMRNYGFNSGRMPASGQLYSFSVARDIPVTDMGPIEKFTVFNDYGYLHSYISPGEHDYQPGAEHSMKENGHRLSGMHSDTLGVAMYSGPLTLWADITFGKNDQMAFMGANNGNWHTRFNLTGSIAFDGELFNN